MAKGNGNTVLPGLEEFFEEDNDEAQEFHSGAPDSRIDYFDAMSLPDMPEYQRNAHGNQSYILHILFPSMEEMTRALQALTYGERKSFAKQAKLGTINGVKESKNMGKPFLELWEQHLKNYKVKAKEITTKKVSNGKSNRKK
jgi:hypothetical protein